MADADTTEIAEIPDSETSWKAWGVAIACAIGMAVSVVPFHIGTFPLFLKPVSAEFGWGRADFAASVQISAIFAALAAPFVGRAVDRWGAKRLLIPAIIIYALATMAQSQLTTSRPQFIATYVVLGFFEAVAGPVAFAHIISTWFQKRRGLMLALVIGAAPTISIMIMAPVTRSLIDTYGWRTSYIILGGIVLVLALPAFAFLLREPERKLRAQAAPAGSPAQPALPGLGVGQVLGKVTFWLIVSALVIHSLVVGGVRAHTVALLSDRGISLGLATAALSLSAFAGLLGNTVSGVLLDRFPTPRIALPFFICALAGLLLFDHAATSGFAVLAGVAVLGFGIGAESGLGPYFLSRYFGLKSFGAIYGCLVSLLAISSGVGPLLFGLSFDASGSYRQGLTIAEIALLAGAGLIALLGPYVYAAHGRPMAAEGRS